MKLSKLLDRFSHGYRQIQAWGEKHGEAMGWALAAGLVAGTAAWGIRGCATGNWTPVFAKNPTPVVQTVDAATQPAPELSK